MCSHLEYRSANRDRVETLNPTEVIGAETKVYVDSAAGVFCVSSGFDWRSENPDVIGIGQVTACDCRVTEGKVQVFTRDGEGRRISFDPPRFEMRYRFDITIRTDIPWMKEITFELTGSDRPDSRLCDAYLEYERQAVHLRHLLIPSEPDCEPAAAVPSGEWVCPDCGIPCRSRFCPDCGAARPLTACPGCGWKPEGKLPRFCPDCGRKLG